MVGASALPSVAIDGLGATSSSTHLPVGVNSATTNAIAGISAAREALTASMKPSDVWLYGSIGVTRVPPTAKRCTLPGVHSVTSIAMSCAGKSFREALSRERANLRLVGSASGSGFATNRAVSI